VLLQIYGVSTYSAFHMYLPDELELDLDLLSKLKNP